MKINKTITFIMGLLLGAGLGLLADGLSLDHYQVETVGADVLRHVCNVD